MWLQPLSAALGPHFAWSHAKNLVFQPSIYQVPSRAARFSSDQSSSVDVQDLFEDSRRAPVSRLAPGYSVYRRPRMAEEGVPANAELV